MINKSRFHSGLIKSAFVLGSTSEVSRAICHALALKGCRQFHLIARNEITNQCIAKELQKNYGVSVTTQQTDLIMDASLDNKRDFFVGEFDLYLIAAGTLGDADLARSDSSEALGIMAANVSGLIPWLTAITTEERLLKPGRLWVFSSVASDRGRPSNYHYGAAKAALTKLCEGLMLRCQGKPFSVRILKAGFMATPMTIGKVPKVLCLPPSAVACDLLRRPNKRGIEYLPWWWSLVMLLVRLLPASMVSRL